jgi:metallophosphoesterase (TIGR00282 family)
MRILAVGDVVGADAVRFLKENLRKMIKNLGVDLTVVNGENAADVKGISRADVAALFEAGADVITTGNHAFGQRDCYDALDDEKYLLRPDNFPGGAPGHGSVIINAAGQRVLVMNLQGNMLMRVSLASPFTAADAILRRESGKYDVAVLDFHAEATSEKQAMGRYLDGRVDAIFGTHTHVATADERVLPKGSGYITDVGMTGVEDGILGAAAEPVMSQFLTAMPARFYAARGKVRANAVIFDIEKGKGCVKVERINF